MMSRGAQAPPPPERPDAPPPSSLPVGLRASGESLPSQEIDMQLRSELVETVIDDPRRGFERISLRCEIRWDPLTGITSRLLPSAGSSAIPLATTDLVGLAESTRPGCPFCADEIEQLTPRFADEMVPGGRFRRGEAWLFPNLLPYSKYSSVCVFSAERHLLPLSEMTPELVSDNLAAQ